MIEVRPITPDAIDELLANLRPIDRIELDCMMPQDPRAGLIAMAAQARRARAAYIGGDLAGIFGVSAKGLLSDTGCPWMLATQAGNSPRARRLLVECSHVGLDWLSQDFARLWNVVAVENVAAIRWLRWMGFDFGAAVVVRGHEFRYFWKDLTDARVVDRATSLGAVDDTGVGRRAA